MRIIDLKFRALQESIQVSILLLCVLFNAFFVANSYAADKNSINDPAYGEVLFHLYEGNQFDALSRALIANNSSQPSNGEDIQFLLPKLYLDYGMLVQSRIALEKLPVTKQTAADIQRDWIKLARAWYQRRNVKEASEILKILNKSMPEDLQDEKNALQGLLAMEAEQYDQAIKAFRQIKPNSDWGAYSRYNQGIALLRIGQLDEGVNELNKLGRENFATEELKALKDQANLALGYLFLQAKEPFEATPFLERVRLSGIHSAKALLGIGWANLMLEKYEKALAPWMEVLKREPNERAVLETYLAVPHSFAQAKAAKQALDHYERAIAVFNKQLEGVNTAISSIKAQGITNQLFKQSGKKISQTILPPKSPEGRTYKKLFSDPVFSSALANYRDLNDLDVSLKQWSTEVNVYKSTFAARTERAKNQKPAGEDFQAVINQSIQRDSDHKRQAENLAKRVQNLKEKLAITRLGHEQYFSQMFLTELEKEKATLDSYLTQARFDMAQLYDRVLNGEMPK